MQHLPTVNLNGDDNSNSNKANERQSEDGSSNTKLTSNRKLFSKYKQSILFNINSLNRLHKTFNLRNHDFVCLCTATTTTSTSSTETNKIDRNVTIKKSTKHDEKNRQKSHIGITGFTGDIRCQCRCSDRGHAGIRNGTYLTCFIFKCTQLFLIIIFLMSCMTIAAATTTTTTQFCKQVNCEEIFKPLEATTIETSTSTSTPSTTITKSKTATAGINRLNGAFIDSNDTKTKTKINFNVNKMKFHKKMTLKKLNLNFTLTTRLPEFRYIYDEMMTTSFFENGTTALRKIETERRKTKTKTKRETTQIKNSQILISRNISNRIRNKSNQSKNSESREIKKDHHQGPSKKEEKLMVLNRGKNTSVDLNFDSIDDDAFEIDASSRLQTRMLKIITPKVRGLHRQAVDLSDNNNAEHKNAIDTQKLSRLIMEGLGLKKFPDMRKVNISQEEYISKYVEYFERIQKHKLRDTENSMVTLLPNNELHLLSIAMNSSVDITFQRRKRSTEISSKNFLHSRRHSHSRSDDDKINILLQFALNNDAALISSESVEEANIRLMLIYSPSLAVKRRNGALRKNKNEGRSEHSQTITTNNQHDFHQEYCNQSSTSEREIQKKVSKLMTENHILNLKVFYIMPGGKRELLDRRSIEFEAKDGGNTDASRSQWLEFDVTRAVKATLQKHSAAQMSTNILGLEVQCNNCKRIGARILNDVSNTPNAKINHHDDRYQLLPVLNIIGRGGEQSQQLHATNEHTSEHNAYQHKDQINKRKSKNCYKPHQRCCRHHLDVVFKEIKGFEFIIQPKVFDAGYCQGRCPPRHNPAHHHALLQSLIWKQDHGAAPRPCCAPSKLLELEVLHVDEKDSEKLKISTWSEMQVVECSCS